MRNPFRRAPTSTHRTCAACGCQIFHARDDKGNIVPLDSEPEMRYLVPENQLTILSGGGHRPHAMHVRTFSGHIQTCAGRKADKRHKATWRQ